MTENVSQTGHPPGQALVCVRSSDQLARPWPQLGEIVTAGGLVLSPVDVKGGLEIEPHSVWQQVGFARIGEDVHAVMFPASWLRPLLDDIDTSDVAIAVAYKYGVKLAQMPEPGVPLPTPEESRKIAARSGLSDQRNGGTQDEARCYRGNLQSSSPERVNAGLGGEGVTQCVMQARPRPATAPPVTSAPRFIAGKPEA